MSNRDPRRASSSYRGSDHRGSSRLDSLAETTSSKPILTTAPGFAVAASTNGILPPHSSRPPTNLDELRQRATMSRRSASPSEARFNRYVNAIGDAANETTVQMETLELLKEYDDRGYNRAFNQAFTAYPKDAEFNRGLSAAQPDFYEGPKLSAYAPFPVRSRVPGAVLYDDRPGAVTLAHIAGEWKGPDGSMTEAALQSGYDGAALVYSRNRALAYQDRSDPPGHASITTFTTDGNVLHTYAHYAASGDDGKTLYHQYPIDTISLVNSHESHKAGRKAIRNYQDEAKRLSQSLKDDLKDHYTRHPDHRVRPSSPVRGREHYEDVGSAHGFTRNGRGESRASSSHRDASRYRSH